MDTPTIYCEQILSTSPQWLNILSSGFFILVAFALVFFFLEKKEKAASTYVLAGLVGLIGVGSILWHIIPSAATDLADTLSIVVFAGMTLWLVLARVFGSCKLRSAVFVVIAAGAFVLEQLPFVNGSLVYIFLLLLLLVVTGYFFSQKKNTWKPLVWASIFFGVAILFRSIDITLCHHLTGGTHFLWHMGVACSAALIVWALRSET